MNRPAPRFGVWAPYRGPWVVPPGTRPEARFALSREVALSADRCGFDTILFAQHTVNPLDPGEEIIDAWTFAAAAAALTERIEIMAAIKPLLHHPAVLAKQALGIEDISGGRFAINFVNGWFKAEMEGAGIAFPGHDARYEYAREWLHIYTALVSGQHIRAGGRHFQVPDYRLRPASLARPRPRIYAGGESEPGRALVAELADCWLITCTPIEDVVPMIDDLRRRPRPDGMAPLDFGTTGFVMARATDGEAQENLEELLRVQDGFYGSRLENLRGKTDPQAALSRLKYPEGRRCVAATGDTLPGFIGSYDRVARRIAEFYDIGIGLFLNTFHPLVAEQELFAAEVIPRALALIGSKRFR